jgi:hypothetical protein
LPGKYSWKALENIYRELITKRLGIFTSDESIFCYIPSEELLAETFGEYPFYSELAPKSIFSLKTHYIAYQMLKEKFEMPGDNKIFRRLKRRSYRKRIEKSVISSFHKNRENIVHFMTWSTVSYLFVMFAIIAYAIAEEVSKIPDNVITVLYSSGTILFMLLSWYFIKSLLSLMRIFRDKHKFLKTFLRVTPQKPSLIQRFSLIKLLFLRFSSIFSLIFILFGIGSFINVIVISSFFGTFGAW